MTHSLVDKAKTFAQKAHGDVGHLRKYSAEPYTVHLEAVATLVDEVSGTPEMVAAAWLHDAVEDTVATIESIEYEFGSEVAVLVAQLTDVSTPDDGNRATRKSIDRAHIALASPAAKTIKLADLIDNAGSIVTEDQRFAKTFMREMQELLDVLRDGDARLFKEAERLLSDYYSRDHQ